MGLRVKLGWAHAVAVEVGEAGAPVVVSRDELRVAPRFRIFGYHAAMDADPTEREAVIAAAGERAVEAATELLAEALADHDADVVAVVVGRGVRKIPLERVLASSQLFHTAEAEILQRGFVEAAATLGVPCRRVTFADVEAHESWAQISSLGRVVGPPWRKDHKHAATAAWIALLGDG
jgi:hypothetical protein